MYNSLMILTPVELNKIDVKDFHLDLQFDKSEFKDPYLRDLRDIHADIVLRRNYDDDFETSLKIKGIMVCPCAITLEDVLLPIDIDEEVLVSKSNDEAFIYENSLNLKELVYNSIASIIPMKVVKEGIESYPKGEGWEVLSEEEYSKQKSETIDPRWEKLKEYKEV